MKKFLVFLLVLTLSFCMFSCLGSNGDVLPDQDMEQDIDDGKQSGAEGSGDDDDSQSSVGSDNAEQSGGENIQGTPVPPIQNGGDFEFN